MSFDDFSKEYNLKNRATSNLKIQQVLLSLSLKDVGTYLGDGLSSSDVGIENLHPSNGTHWVCFINENYFDSYGYVCPKKQSKINIKRYGYCFYL